MVIQLSSQTDRLKRWFRELSGDIVQVSTTLFRLMIPVILLVKVAEELGGVELLSHLLQPLMFLVGLPEVMGVVWAVTILTNIYGGMMVFFTLAADVPMTQAQVTVIGCMMLIAHALPVEVRIAQLAGVRPLGTLIVRLLGGFTLGFLLSRLYLWGDWLQQPSLLQWVPQQTDKSLSGWAVSQIQSLFMILIIIAVLLSLLKVLKGLGIERLFIWLLQPLLRVLGIGPAATTITIIGITLGLAFGGGLLIKEARAGHVPYHDVLCSMTLLALCHSLIEDTLLVLLLGAHLSGVLWGRLAFSLLLVALMSRLLRSRDEGFYYRYLMLPLKGT